MVTTAQAKQQIAQQERQLSTSERQAKKLTAQRVPQRKFGTRVTRQQQQRVIREQREGTQALKKIKQERARLQQVKQKIRQIESKRRELAQAQADIKIARKFANRNIPSSLAKQDLSKAQFDLFVKFRQGINVQEELVNRSKELQTLETQFGQTLSPEVRQSIIKRGGLAEIEDVGTPVGSGIGGGVLVQTGSGVREFLPVQTLQEGGVGVVDITQEQAPVRKPRSKISRVLEAPLDFVETGIEASTEKTFRGVQTAEAIFGIPFGKKGTPISKKIEPVAKPVFRTAGEVSTFFIPGVAQVVGFGLASRGVRESTDPALSDIERVGAGLEATIGVTLIGRGAVRGAGKLFEPIVKVAPVPKTRVTSQDIQFISSESGISKAMFVLKSETPRRTAKVTTRLRDFLALEPKVVEVQKASKIVTVSEPFLVKEGKIVGQAKVITGGKGKKTVVSKISGGLTRDEMSISKSLGRTDRIGKRQIQAIAEEKAGGIPVSEESLSKLFKRDARFERGEVTSFDFFKIIGRKTKKPRAKLIPKGRRIRRGRLVSKIEEIKLPKEVPESVTAFKTFTAVKDVTFPLARASGKIPVIRGTTISIEKASKDISDVGTKIVPSRRLKRKQTLKTLKAVAEIKAGAVLKSPKLPTLTKKQVGKKAFKKSAVFSEEALRIQQLPRAVGGGGKTITRLAPLETEQTLSRESTKEIALEKLLPKSLTREITKPLTKETTKLVPRERAKTTTRLAPKLLTKLSVKSLTKPINIPPARLTRTPRQPKGKKPLLPLPLLKPSRRKGKRVRKQRVREDAFLTSGFTARALGLKRAVKEKDLLKESKLDERKLGIRAIPIVR